MSSNRGIVLLFLFTTLASLCSAQLVEVKAGGTVSVISGNDTWPWIANYGDRFQFEFIADVTQAPTQAYPDTNVYVYPLLSGYGQIGSNHWDFDQQAGGLMVAFDALNDAFFAWGDSGIYHFGFGLNTSKHSGSPGIPTALPPLADFDLVRFVDVWIYSDPTQPYPGIWAEIDELSIHRIAPPSVPVPEPSTYGLAATFLIFAAVLWRRTRPTSRKLNELTRS